MLYEPVVAKGNGTEDHRSVNWRRAVWSAVSFPVPIPYRFPSMRHWNLTFNRRSNSLLWCFSLYFSSRDCRVRLLGCLGASTSCARGSTPALSHTQRVSSQEVAMLIDSLHSQTIQLGRQERRRESSGAAGKDGEPQTGTIFKKIAKKTQKKTTSSTLFMTRNWRAR